MPAGSPALLLTLSVFALLLQPSPFCSLAVIKHVQSLTGASQPLHNVLDAALSPAKTCAGARAGLSQTGLDLTESSMCTPPSMQSSSLAVRRDWPCRLTTSDHNAFSAHREA